MNKLLLFINLIFLLFLGEANAQVAQPPPTCQLTFPSSGTLSLIKCLDRTGTFVTIGGVDSNTHLFTLGLSLVPPGTAGLANLAVNSYTAGAPILGNGTNAFAYGTIAGNTTNFAAVDSALVNGNFVKADAYGGLVDGGSVASVSANSLTGTTLASNVVNSSLTNFGSVPTIQNASGNISILPKATTGAQVQIAPISPYNGQITAYIDNGTSGVNVSSDVSLATGSTNSYANFVLYDNNGAPYEQLYSGPGVTGGFSIYSQTGNLALSSQTGTLALTAAIGVTSQTPSQGDNSTKIATTAFVQNPNNIGFQQPDAGSINSTFYNLLNQGMPIQVVPQFCSYATWNSTATQAATSCVQAAATALCNRPVIGGVLQMPPGNPHFSDITFRCPTIVQGSGRGVTQVYNVGESSFVFKWEPTAWPAIPSTALMNGGGLFDIGVQNQVTSSGTIIQVHGMENFSTARVNIFNPWNGWESIGLEHADIQDYYLQGTYNLDWNFHGDLTGYTNSSTACTTSNNDCSTRSDFITLRSIENIDNRQTNTCFQFSGFIATIMMDHTACEGPLIGLNIVCPTGLSTTLAQCPHFILSNDFQTEFWHQYGLYVSDFLDVRMKEPYSYGDYTSANGPTLAVSTVNYGSSNAAGQMTMEDGLFFSTWQSDIYINGTLTDIMLSHNKIYGGNGGNAGYGAIDVEGPVTQVRIDNNTLCTVGGYSGGYAEAFGVNIGSGVSKVQSENNSMYGCTKRLNNVSAAPYSVFSRNDVGPGGAPALGACGTATIVGTDLSFYVSITGGSPTSCTVNFGSVQPEQPIFAQPAVAPGGTAVLSIATSTSQVVFSNTAGLSGTYLLTGSIN